MDSFLAPLLAYLLLYKYAAIFVVMCSASIILPLPTNSLLLAAGAFASQGYFSFALSLAAAVGGNMAGDFFDYFLARRYGHRAIHILHINVPSYVQHLERFMHNYAGTTIFFTRFVGTVDSLTNVLAGFSGVGVVTFMWYDFLGNLVSDGVVIYIGYVFGANWQAVTGTFSLVEWVLLGVFVAVGLVVALWYRGRLSKKQKSL